jgi:ABC-type branched-subunit amino acid transport system ATPase component
MITVRNLNAGYGKLIVLHDLSMTFAQNQFTAVLGPNGSGKSTLLKSILGLATVHDGSIQFEGQELTSLPTEAISECGIAYVPQRNNVFTAMTVRENLLLATRKRTKTEASQAMDEAFALFPILAKRQSQRAGNLSGGERQMAAIALGWLLRPRLMLLDEPSAGLSPLIATELFRVIKQMSEQNITMIVVEQNARSILRWCSHVFVLREGQLAFQGSAEECLNNEELVKSYLGVGLNVAGRGILQAAAVVDTPTQD